MSVLPDSTISRVTTADGRSPGSRVRPCVAFRNRNTQWLGRKIRTLTVAGAATQLGTTIPPTVFPFNPLSGNRRSHLGLTIKTESMCECGRLLPSHNFWRFAGRRDFSGYPSCSRRRRHGHGSTHRRADDLSDRAQLEAIQRHLRGRPRAMRARGGARSRRRVALGGSIRCRGRFSEQDFGE